MRRKLKPGDLYKVWWFTDSDPPNIATILAIEKYTGMFTKFFNATLRLSAPNTYRGWLEMAVKLESRELPWKENN